MAFLGYLACLDMRWFSYVEHFCPSDFCLSHPILPQYGDGNTTLKLSYCPISERERCSSLFVPPLRKFKTQSRSQSPYSAPTHRVSAAAVQVLPWLARSSLDLWCCRTEAPLKATRPPQEQPLAPRTEAPQTARAAPPLQTEVDRFGLPQLSVKPALLAPGGLFTGSEAASLDACSVAACCRRPVALHRSPSRSFGNLVCH
jgi:hypothetical protein